jgi:hypothetical protein
MKPCYRTQHRVKVKVRLVKVFSGKVRYGYVYVEMHMVRALNKTILLPLSENKTFGHSFFFRVKWLLANGTEM